MADTPITTDEPHFLYFYFNWVKASFVKALRIAFASSSTPDVFKYSAVQNTSQIDIRSDWPKRITKLPMIVVSTGSGNANVTYVGDEFLREATIADDGIEGYVYGGLMTLGVDIKLFASEMRTAEHLSDLITFYVRTLFRSKFAEYRMAYVEVTPSGITQEENIYMNTVSTTVTVDWEQIIDRKLYDEVKAINLDITTYNT